MPAAVWPPMATAPPPPEAGCPPAEGAPGAATPAGAPATPEVVAPAGADPGAAAGSALQRGAPVVVVSAGAAPAATEAVMPPADCVAPVPPALVFLRAAVARCSFMTSCPMTMKALDALTPATTARAPVATWRRLRPPDPRGVRRDGAGGAPVPSAKGASKP